MRCSSSVFNFDEAWPPVEGGVVGSGSTGTLFFGLERLESPPHPVNVMQISRAAQITCVLII